MIKRKNIALYAFTFLATLLFGYSNVFASYNVGDKFRHVPHVIGNSNSKTNVADMFYYCKSGSSCEATSRNIQLHSFVYKANNNAVRAYCMDPFRKSPTEYYNEYEIVSKLDFSKPIDRAIMFILSADVKDFDTRADKENRFGGEEADYTIKSSAIRALLPLTGQYFALDADEDLKEYIDETGQYHYAYAYALLNSGLYWASSGEGLTTEEIQTVFGPLCPANNCDNRNVDGEISPRELYENIPINLIDKPQHTLFRTNYVNFHYSHELSGMNGTTRIIADASHPWGATVKNLYIEALKYAARTSADDYRTKNIVYNRPIEFTSVIEKNADNSSYADFAFQMTFENFISSDVEDDDIFVKLSSNNPHFSISNLEYSVGVTSDNKKWVKFDSSYDFKDIIDSDSFTINVRGRVTADDQVTKETVVSLDVKPTYQDRIIPEAYYAVNTLSDSYQRFFIYDQSQSEIYVEDEMNFTPPWNPPTSTCENAPSNSSEDSDEFKEWIEQCCYPSEDDDFNVIDACEEATKNNNEEDKAKYCGYKEKYCSLCNTDIEVPQTCVELDADGTFEGNIDGADMNATIDGPDALSICTKDSAGNSRETSETKGNRYCSVQCKEDYDISLPRGKYVTSGRYFELALKMTGTKTCSTDSIDFEEFRQDHDRLYNMIKSGNTDKKIIDEYNDIVSDIKECTNFNVDYSMNPEISYTYDEEEYIEKFGQDEFKFINVQELEGASSKKYCTGFDIDAKGDKLTGCHENADLIGIAGLDCSSGSCKDTTLNLNKTKYVVKSVQKAALYAPKTEFYSKYITGEIKTNVTSGVANYSRVAKKVHTDLLGKDVIADVNSVPISLKTNMGIYNYNFKFSNLGEFYDQTKDGKLVLGRILGGKGSVALTDGETEFKGTYLCHYIVNCPECYSICVEDKDKGYTCTLPTKEQCPECYSHGTTVFDSNLGLLASAHNVSLINPFNGRTAGANWNAETNVKAKTALDEITTNGENIYSEPEYSFTFTPAVISYLKGENDKANGDYLNDTMTCKNYSDRYKGTDKYQEALEHDYKVCTSDILRKLKDFDVEVQIDSEEKFTSWLDSDYCKENVCAIVGEPFGPAWK